MNLLKHTFTSRQSGDKTSWILCFHFHWLFPIRETGTNPCAKELQPHEIKVW